MKQILLVLLFRDQYWSFQTQNKHEFPCPLNTKTLDEHSQACCIAVLASH